MNVAIMYNLFTFSWILEGLDKKFRWFLTLSSKNYAIWLIFECARAKPARKSWDLLHRSCWVTLEIHTLRTSPRMEVPTLPSYFWGPAQGGGDKKIKTTLFHQYSWNSEVETTCVSLIGWPHKTSIIYDAALYQKYIFLPDKQNLLIDLGSTFVKRKFSI